MRSINKLTREEAISIVQMIQRRLYLDTDGHGAEFLNPDKDWNAADVCQDIAAILVQYGLVPDTVQPAKSEMEHPLDELGDPPDVLGVLRQVQARTEADLQDLAIGAHQQLAAMRRHIRPIQREVAQAGKDRSRVKSHDSCQFGVPMYVPDSSKKVPDVRQGRFPV